MGRILLAVVLVLLPASLALAQPQLPLVTVTPDGSGGQTYSTTLQVLFLMTLLGLLPSALIMTTSFTRIIIVLAILRQGLGTAQTPNNQILIGLALFLTFFIMAPVFTQAYEAGIKPYMAEEVSAEAALAEVGEPFREFMLAQTRETDLALFARLSGREEFESEADVPFSLLLPAFVTSELKTAFQIGFMLLIPFLIIDLVVASVLMSMGMVMLSPLMISLPFKLMLFVLVDGWTLVMGTLASSFFP
jgi:flagellar biosynthetic protein FliP